MNEECMVYGCQRKSMRIGGPSAPTPNKISSHIRYDSKRDKILSAWSRESGEFAFHRHRRKKTFVVYAVANDYNVRRCINFMNTHKATDIKPYCKE